MYSILRLIIKWAIQAANIEINSHFFTFFFSQFPTLSSSNLLIFLLYHPLIFPGPWNCALRTPQDYSI